MVRVSPEHATPGAGRQLFAPKVHRSAGRGNAPQERGIQVPALIVNAND